MRTKKQKLEQKYEYDDMTDYDNNNNNKDNLSSVYGEEEEEGWEDAVIIDTNPEYECRYFE